MDDQTEGLPLFEIEEKERILEMHSQNHASVLAWLRVCMVGVYLRRVDSGGPAYVTANDARKVMATHNIPTGPWMGALFRTKDWVATGDTVKSTAEGSHARILWCYRPANLW